MLLQVAILCIVVSFLKLVSVSVNRTHDDTTCDADCETKDTSSAAAHCAAVVTTVNIGVRCC